MIGGAFRPKKKAAQPGCAASMAEAADWNQRPIIFMVRSTTGLGVL